MPEIPADPLLSAMQLVVDLFVKLTLFSLPCIIWTAFYFIHKFNKDVKAYLESPEFKRMNASEKDVPSTAVALTASTMREGPDCAIYIGDGNVFLPKEIVTNQAGSAMTQAGMKFLRIPVRDITGITKLRVSRKRGTVTYMLLNVTGIHKPIAIYSGRGLGDPPPEMFDTDKFLKLAGHPPVDDLGILPFYKLFRFI